MNRTMKSWRRATVCGALALGALLGPIAGPLSASAIAQTNPRSAGGGVADLRLNGYWNIDAIARAEFLAKVKADPTPMAKELSARAAETQRQTLARGEAVGLGSYSCGRQGVPFIVGTSEPWLLLITKDEVIQVAERRQMPPRHFHMDGRTLDGVDKLPPSANGYSVAHWENGVLVIQTRGVPSGGLQGGGRRGPKALLTERVSLNAAGNRLTWSYSWEDPDMLLTPLSFSLEYDRAPEKTYAFTLFCDPMQGAGRVVAEPKQD